MAAGGIERVASILAGFEAEATQRLFDRNRALDAAEALGPDRFAPHPSGRVTDAWFDPYEGIKGVIEVDGVGIDGPFAWIGVLSSTEPVHESLTVAWRAGHGGALGLSYVPGRGGEAREATCPDRLPGIVVDRIDKVVAVDLVIGASTSAHLIRPL